MGKYTLRGNDWRKAELNSNLKAGISLPEPGEEYHRARIVLANMGGMIRSKLSYASTEIKIVERGGHLVTIEAHLTNSCYDWDRDDEEVEYPMFSSTKIVRFEFMIPTTTEEFYVELEKVTEAIDKAITTNF